MIGDRRVFYSSGYGSGAAVVELTKAGERFSVREVWRNIRMKNRRRARSCTTASSTAWTKASSRASTARRARSNGRAGATDTARCSSPGPHLVVTTEEGELVLVAATPERLRELARVPAIDGETWNVPAIAGGILLVRNTGEMAAFDLRAGAK